MMLFMSTFNITLLVILDSDYVLEKSIIVVAGSSVFIGLVSMLKTIDKEKEGYGSISLDHTMRIYILRAVPCAALLSMAPLLLAGIIAAVIC